MNINVDNFFKKHPKRREKHLKTRDLIKIRMIDKRLGNYVICKNMAENARFRSEISVYKPTKNKNTFFNSISYGNSRFFVESKPAHQEK
jgi:hypothetical protein